MSETANDDIKLVPPDPNWPHAFESERDHLLDCLRGEAIDVIEHIGSTAIPGLPAKPIIDIEIVVPNLEQARARFPDRLASLDYVFWADNPNRERLFFVKGMPPYGTGRTHHVHVSEGGDSLKRHLTFRDFLRANADAREAYATLKQRLADQHRSDREAYTDAKASFINEVLERAARV